MAESYHGTLNDFLSHVVSDCVNGPDDHEADALPQAQPDSRRVAVVLKRGPAFDGLLNRPLATELARSLQAAGLSAAGDVLNALERRSVSDLVDTWGRLITVLRLDFVSMPLHIGAWGPHPWERLTASVVQALCHADTPAATNKWMAADAAIRGWVRSHAAGLVREREAESNLSSLDIIEDGQADVARMTYLQQQIERYTAFAAGVR